VSETVLAGGGDLLCKMMQVSTGGRTVVGVSKQTTRPGGEVGTGTTTKLPHANQGAAESTAGL
jgi:hypothetical protein